MRGEVRAGRREGGGASGMHGGRPNSRLLGVRARAERTLNICFMLVTLEVSRLSGWLKAAASCQVEGRGTCDAGRGARREAGERARGGSVGMHARGLPQGLGAKGTRGAHVEHEAHGRDAGGVEAQWLVEGRRALPSQREGHAIQGGEVRAGRWEDLGCGGGTQEACTGKRPDSRLLRPRARAERTANM